MEVVKTEKGALPAELLDEYQDDAGDNLENVNTAYFRVSIKGSKFKVEENRIGKEGKGEQFAAVVLRDIPVNSYNKDPYDPAAPAQMPDCWSLGGVRPQPDCEDPQSDSCLTCKLNKFKSAKGKDGKPGKGKACANNRRLVLKVAGFDMPVLLSIPPTSRKNLDAYLKYLSAGEQKIPMFAMLTVFSFDENSDYPVVEFGISNFLPVEEYREIKEYRNSPVVVDALNAYAASQYDGSDNEDEEGDGF